MKMAKPKPQDIDAAGELFSLLDSLDERWGGPWPVEDLPEDLPQYLSDKETSFESDKREHLQVLYNHLARLLRTAPNFHGRVIGGMCYVICWDQNEILDPADKNLSLHPDIRAGLALLTQQRADFLHRLEREARAAVVSTIEAAAQQHLREMREGTLATET